MNPTNEGIGMAQNGVDWATTGILGGIGIIVLAWLKRVDPRLALAWINEPTMRPVHAKIDRLCRVVDKIPGADEAHAQIMAEDERLKKRWEA